MANAELVAFAPDRNNQRVLCDSSGNLTVGYGDIASLDAFSRARVSEPVTLFTSQCQYDAEPLLFESGATFNYSEVR